MMEDEESMVIGDHHDQQQLLEIDDEPLIKPQRVNVVRLDDHRRRRSSVWSGTSSSIMPNWSEMMKIILLRIRSTQVCLSVYVVLLLLNLFILMWEIVGGERGIMIIVIEVIINFMLVMEVSMGLLTQGWQYWKSWTNRADFIVTIICVTFFIIYIEEEGIGTVDDEMTISETVLIGVRYLVQISRLVFLACRGQWSHEILGQDDVDFSLVYDDDAEDMELRSARSGSTSETERQHLIGGDENANTPSTRAIRKLRKQLSDLEQDIENIV